MHVCHERPCSVLGYYVGECLPTGEQRELDRDENSIYGDGFMHGSIHIPVLSPGSTLFSHYMVFSDRLDFIMRKAR